MSPITSGNVDINSIVSNISELKNEYQILERRLEECRHQKQKVLLSLRKYNKSLTLNSHSETDSVSKESLPSAIETSESKQSSLVYNLVRDRQEAEDLAYVEKILKKLQSSNTKLKEICWKRRLVEAKYETFLSDACHFVRSTMEQLKRLNERNKRDLETTYRQLNAALLLSTKTKRLARMCVPWHHYSLRVMRGGDELSTTTKENQPHGTTSETTSNSTNETTSDSTNERSNETTSDSIIETTNEITNETTSESTIDFFDCFKRRFDVFVTEKSQCTLSSGVLLTNHQSSLRQMEKLLHTTGEILTKLQDVDIYFRK